MTSDRPYRPAMTLERAQQELRSCAGKQFDAKAITALLAETPTPPVDNTSSYPDGLVGEQIPLASRITLACDALNAMTSDRPYRPAMTLERAQQELRSCAGGQFDPQTIKALLAEIATPAESPAADRPA